MSVIIPKTMIDEEFKTRIHSLEHRFGSKEKVEEYMLTHSYKRKQSDSGHVMEYEKEPCFNFEMHRALYHTNNPAFYAYYKDVKERLKKGIQDTLFQRL